MNDCSSNSTYRRGRIHRLLVMVAHLLCSFILIGSVASCEGTRNGKSELGHQPRWQHPSNRIMKRRIIPEGRSKWSSFTIPSSASFIWHPAIPNKRAGIDEPTPFTFQRSRLLIGSNEDNLMPMSQYWVDDKILKKGEIIQLCTTETEEEVTSHHSPTVTTIHRNTAGSAIAVEVASAITLNEVATLRALSGSIRTGIDIAEDASSSSCLDGSSASKISQHFEHRSFGTNKGGNDCTYLAPFLQALCPNIAMTVKEIATLAWEKADWNSLDSDTHPNPMSLGIRTSEFLSYKGWPSLEAHKDVGSIYTIMMSIKDPCDYDGGEFFLHNSMIESTNVKLDKLSAIVFKSDTTHGVRQITLGHRESFVTELWLNHDSPVGVCRPTEEQWETFLETEC